VTVFYADAIALVKLLREESESSALRAFLADADIVSSELVLAEIPRAIHRAVMHEPELPFDLLVQRAGELLDAIALRPPERSSSQPCEPSTRSRSPPLLT
jgi:predicted nucleic acid-binding protein